MISVNYQNVVQDILMSALRAKMAEITTHVLIETKGVVQTGPFQGMFVPQDISWGLGEIAAKLLGSYERELDQIFEKAIARKPDVIFNVGCAEGHYAVGLARRLPLSTVIAIDTDARARELSAKSAEVNGVHEHFVVESVLNIGTLQYLMPHENGLLVMDVEGDEVKILDDPEKEIVPSLRRSDLVIECHDFKDLTIPDQLARLFSQTHEIEIVKVQGRDNTIYPAIAKLGDFERALSVCEFRPAGMQWLVGWSKDRG